MSKNKILKEEIEIYKFVIKNHNIILLFGFDIIL